MSTAYQTYSHNQTFVPQINGYACPPPPAMQAMPQMVPMGSPVFQPLPAGPIPQVYFPQPVPQMNCSFQGLPSMMVSACSSLDSSSSLSEFSHTSSNEMNSFPVLTSVGSFDYFQRSPSPGCGMVSYSPQPYPMLSPMIGLVPANSCPLPGMVVPQAPQMVSTGSSVTVTNWNSNTSDPVLPEPSVAKSQNLGPRDNTSVSRDSSPSRSISRDRSLSGFSLTENDGEGVQDAEPSKRELVNGAFAKLQAMFGANFDQNGNRGKNIVRLKVKTRVALEQIVPLIEFIQQNDLIISISCPISTKKGRQQVRGFLAYLQTKDAQDADRVEDLIRQYNSSNGSPFNSWHRNPPSTWNQSSA